MNHPQSSKQSASAVHGYLLLDHFDWMIVAAILILTFVMATSAGLRRGVELMPWPDGLEYAASGVNLANGRGAVLHFGGYTYPSRYTAGYPLILAFFHRLYGGEFRPLNASLILGMLSVFGIFMLARGQFWRLAATVAALLLALSPVFITYSSLVMSDVPDIVRYDLRRGDAGGCDIGLHEPIVELDTNVGMVGIRSPRRFLDDHPSDQRNDSCRPRACAS